MLGMCWIYNRRKRIDDTFFTRGAPFRYYVTIAEKPKEKCNLRKILCLSLSTKLTYSILKTKLPSLKTTNFTLCKVRDGKTAIAFATPTNKYTLCVYKATKLEHAGSLCERLRCKL